MKRVVRAAILSWVVCRTPAAWAYSTAPTFLYMSGLASSDASKDINIALHKAVTSQTTYVLDRTDHPENAFDGNDNTATGAAGDLIVDFGGVYVVDSVTIKFAGFPSQINIAWSPYLGETALAPTYDLAAGVGRVPDSESANLEFRDLAWINDAKLVDDRKLPAQPARFLRFHFHAVYMGQWVNPSIKEIEVYGHPYVPTAGDAAFLSRKKWQPSAFADAAPNGEGETVTHAIDGQLTNAWLPHAGTAPGEFYQVDLGAEVSFNQVFTVFTIGSAPDDSSVLNVLASDDPMSWGAPVTQLHYGESASKQFPERKARYLRLEPTTTASGWWQIDELNLLAPASASGNAIPAPDAGTSADAGPVGAGGGAPAKPMSGAGGSGGSGVSAGGSGATGVTSEAGGTSANGASQGEPHAAGDTPATDAGCACRAVPSRSDFATVRSSLALALGALLMRVRAGRRRNDGRRFQLGN